MCQNPGRSHRRRPLARRGAWEETTGVGAAAAPAAAERAERVLRRGACPPEAAGCALRKAPKELLLWPTALEDRGPLSAEAPAAAAVAVAIVAVLVRALGMLLPVL
mmetsp:Transcript_52875/g.112882  ORF Transcript_52875/g.112882 Transcript_52875/m.112882 type:complete len:106 (+) Transcript_52875:56-373(+)